MRFVVALILGAIAIFGSYHAAYAANRIALVVGNSEYNSAGLLPNAATDAVLVENSLKQIGFETLSAKNVSVSAFRESLKEFRQQALGADVAIIYFAGHGIELNGKNWLVPSDAKLGSDYDLPDEAVDLDRLMDALTGARTRIAIIDACRNNPFGQRWATSKRSMSRGLARVESDDVLVLYAAAPGMTAEDGQAGRSSPFAASLAKRLLEPGVPVQMLGGLIRDDVIAATAGRQRPYVSASMTGVPIYLAPNINIAPQKYDVRTSGVSPAATTVIPTPPTAHQPNSAKDVCAAGFLTVTHKDFSGRGMDGMTGSELVKLTSCDLANGRFETAYDFSKGSIPGTGGNISADRIAFTFGYVDKNALKSWDPRHKCSVNANRIAPRKFQGIIICSETEISEKSVVTVEF